MLKYVFFLSVIVFFGACKDKGKNILDEMAGRGVNEPYESLFLQDTAVASLKKVTIKDNYYKVAIEREVADFYKKYNYQTRRTSLRRSLLPISKPLRSLPTMGFFHRIIDNKN